METRFKAVFLSSLLWMDSVSMGSVGFHVKRQWMPLRLLHRIDIKIHGTPLPSSSLPVCLIKRPSLFPGGQSTHTHTEQARRQQRKTRGLQRRWSRVTSFSRRVRGCRGNLLGGGLISIPESRKAARAERKRTERKKRTERTERKKDADIQVTGADCK